MSMPARRAVRRCQEKTAGIVEPEASEGVVEHASDNGVLTGLKGIAGLLLPFAALLEGQASLLDLLGRGRRFGVAVNA